MATKAHCRDLANRGTVIVPSLAVPDGASDDDALRWSQRVVVTCKVAEESLTRPERHRAKTYIPATRSILPAATVRESSMTADDQVSV